MCLPIRAAPVAYGLVFVYSFFRKKSFLLHGVFMGRVVKKGRQSHYKTTCTLIIFMLFSASCLFDKPELIIPGLSEPPVRTLRATIPENGSHMYIPVIQSHLIGLCYIYFLYTVNTHLWCEYR